METKKISFGFMKTKKAEKPVVEEKKDFIECVEDKSVKVVGGETEQEEAPLIIPMKPNTLITAERLKEIAEKVEKGIKEAEIVKTEPPDLDVPVVPAENESLDQMAVRELLQEAKKEVKAETQSLTVPVPAKPVIDGEKESTLEDYESVPIQDFGLAMLRGMGWTPSKDSSKYKPPELRPKGLGLGADKVVKENQKKKTTNDKGEELTIVKNSFVKITTGKYAGYYGKVVSLDEDNGRVMVDIAVKKETVSLSEFMMQPVTKAEYDKESKVINADAFEEYKRLESEKSSKNRDTPKAEKSEREPSGSRHKTNNQDTNRERKNTDDSSNGRSRDRRSESSSDEDRVRKQKKKNKNRSSSSEDDRRKKNKSKRHQSSSSDDSESYRSRRKSPEHKKRDIDKKRKGKKKKRDRDRSPNYKKHRK